MSTSKPLKSLVWFRKGLRLHDNPALIDACRAERVYPVFCIDPHFAKPDVVGVNRYNFLLETLQDLDRNLRSLGSRLFILQGKPDEQILQAVMNWEIDLVTYEIDTEPYAKVRDARVSEQLREKGVRVNPFSSHTLHNLEQYVAKSRGGSVSSYQSFMKLFDSCGAVRNDVPAPITMPAVSDSDLENDQYNIPSITDMGYTEVPTSRFKGGETEALHRLEMYVTSRPAWVNGFAKPDTPPNSLEPSTTVLSPYLKFGCLSAAKFYHEVDRINKGKNHTAPPVSLHGQLLWREFFYYQGYVTRNFDRMIGNPTCRQIPWEFDAAKLQAWKEGRTGFPFIDAIMTQLRVEGWIHHLARHAVACFLTRGDLFHNWEEGVRVFDLYLLDDDWALNNANWQWLSCSNFFYQYFRCYSPIAFGKKTDKDGLYIKKWLPQLSNFPEKYIYEPWKAPLAIQQRANCIIGKDYPMPIVEHEVVSKENMEKMKHAYANQATVLHGWVDGRTAGEHTNHQPPSAAKNTKRAREIDVIDISGADEDENAGMEEDVNAVAVSLPKNSSSRSSRSPSSKKRKVT